MNFSLNRFCIPTSEGEIPAGKLISKHRLLEIIHAEAPLLNPTEISPQLLDNWLIKGDLNFQSVAQNIADDISNTLVTLLQTLKSRSTPLRDIENFYFAGGLSAGEFGLLVIQTTQSKLPSLKITRSIYPAHSSLVGIARRFSNHISHGLVFDFGGTSIKRGIVSFNNGAIHRLSTLPAYPAQNLLVEKTVSNEAAQRLFDYMLGVIMKTSQEFEDHTIHEINIAMACYLDKTGHPIDAGWYGNLKYLTDNVPQMFSDILSNRLGYDIKVCFTHDASAASLVYAGQPQTAVITLGTAMGWGISPQSIDGLLPLSEQFASIILAKKRDDNFFLQC